MIDFCEFLLFGKFKTINISKMIYIKEGNNSL